MNTIEIALYFVFGAMIGFPLGVIFNQCIYGLCNRSNFTDFSSSSSAGEGSAVEPKTTNPPELYAAGRGGDLAARRKKHDTAWIGHR
jgi:hypothetical protein